jgi:RHS repeat-associated protein
LFVPSDFGFAGGWGYQSEYFDATNPGLGLQYLEQRYYDPAIGRFLTPDPIGWAGGLNLYAYCDNDPLNYVDPSGLFWREILSVLGGIAGALAGLPEGGVGAIPGGIYGSAAGGYLGSGLDGNPIPRALRDGVVDGAMTAAGGKAGQLAAGAVRARKAQRAAQAAAACRPGRQQVVRTLRAVLLRKAGFGNTGVPIIVDNSLGRSSTLIAQALRARGINARSVIEIFGGDPGDPAILNLAEQLGARVLTSDKGSVLGEGFSQLGIRVRQRLSVDSYQRLIQDALRLRKD